MIEWERVEGFMLWSESINIDDHETTAQSLMYLQRAVLSASEIVDFLPGLIKSLATDGVKI